MSSRSVLMRFFLLTLFLSASAVEAAKPSAGTPGAKQVSPATGLVLEIARNGGPPFYVPLVASNQHTAIIPLSDTAASAVRIVPKLTPAGVQVRVFAVYCDLKKIKDACAEVRSLPADLTGSYQLTEREDTVAVDSAFEFGNEQIQLRLLKPEITTPAGKLKRVFLEDAAGGCCGCNGLSCCPNPGFCLTCDVCGQCCAQKQPEE